MINVVAALFDEAITDAFIIANYLMMFERKLTYNVTTAGHNILEETVPPSPLPLSPLH